MKRLFYQVTYALLCCLLLFLWALSMNMFSDACAPLWCVLGVSATVLYALYCGVNLIRDPGVIEYED